MQDKGPRIKTRTLTRTTREHHTTNHRHKTRTTWEQFGDHIGTTPERYNINIGGGQGQHRNYTETTLGYHRNKIGATQEQHKNNT